MDDLREKVKNIFSDIHEVGKFDFGSDENIAINKIMVLFKEQEEEIVKQIRYGNLGRCPRHYEALRCLVCANEVDETERAEEQ